MATDNKDSRYHALSLRQIAGWEIPSVDNSNSKIIAKVPSLQRGLVWEPQQIELLWDSLMQGFPIGSLVLSAKNSEQKDKAGNFSAIANQKPVTHHILDGQQRCYAIALGFHNLWHDNDQAILWLDLKPGNRLQNSIRQYLFRVTTKSHPWGFGHDNQSSRLSAGNIRESLGTHTERPLPKELRPFDAGLPVPVFLLFKHFNMGTEKLNWDAFSEDLAKLIPNSAGITYDDSIDRENIEGGLSLAEEARIIALQVPAKVKKIESIENIEQIFQRLNRQGTPLDNEELTYSMIKAYWPDVEECLESLDSLRHTTEPRLINMAIRVALTGQDGKMHTELTVDRIRNIFRPSDSKVRKKEDIDDANKAIAIKEYFQDKLKLALQWIDDHFLFHEKNRPYGLPAYLRSSLAWNSRNVFAWLMVVAKRYDYKPVTNEQLLKKIIGLALSIHWFGSDKTKAVEKLLLEKDLGSENVKLSNLKNDKGDSLIFSPIDKVELEEILSLSKDSTKKSLSDWKSFWHAIVEADDQNQPRKEKDKEDRSKKYGQFMERLRNNRELLVYVQRSYFASKFGDFDPSNRLMWKEHNRPWDYDHILPSNKLNASGRGGNAGDFHDVCKVWQQSIGNLIAVDFTFNRGEQDNTSSKKYNSERAGELNGVLDCIDAYDIELEDTANFEKSIAFVVAARNRLIELYRRWYDSLNVGNYK